MISLRLMISQAIDLEKPFVLLEKEGRVACHQGPLHSLKKLQEIDDLAKRLHSDVAFVLPYRVISERGFEAHGEEPILAMAIEKSIEMPIADFIGLLPDQPIAVEGEIQPSISNEAYAEMVARFQKTEIEGGNASQVTLSRRFVGKIKDFELTTVLSIYRRLLQTKGQYMTVLFCFHDPADPKRRRFIVGATPERHLEIVGNETIMIPIAGTLRKEEAATFPARLKQFIVDPKEINELFQVMDEEMKMMSLICPDGGVIRGPLLREIGAVVHTEYELVGRRGLDTIDALRRTLHAPTVVGSPMESAARIIKKYEPDSRRYYGGEIGVYKQPRTEARNGDLDSAILIRCAEIADDGTFFVQAGGGLVRDSDPASEAKESHAKAMGFLSLLLGSSVAGSTYLTDALRREVAAPLEARNQFLSTFWMAKQSLYPAAASDLTDLHVTILNNEDDFAHMLGHILRKIGVSFSVVDTLSYEIDSDKADIIVIGPGPGDPNDQADPRMARLQKIIGELKRRQKPMLGVCLGHQTIAVYEGLEVKRQTKSTQGMQRQVRVFGALRKLGFYNSFSPVLTPSAEKRSDLTLDVDDEGRIVAMRGPNFIGFQFHPESVMSESGYALVQEALEALYALNPNVGVSA